MRTIKIMPEYQCSPLWERHANGAGNTPPEDLPISKILREKLWSWAKQFDATFNENDPMRSGFLNAEALSDFNAEGRHLADMLSKELGVEFIIVNDFRAMLADDD